MAIVGTFATQTRDNGHVPIRAEEASPGDSELFRLAAFSELAPFKGATLTMALSETIGNEKTDYYFQPDGASYTAANPDHQLAIDVTASAVSITMNEDSWQLSSEAAASEISAEGNRLTIQREGYDEWYVNGPLGLQQGFTLYQPAAIALRMGGTLPITASPHSLKIGEQFTFTGLMAYDASGQTIPIHFELAQDRLVYAYNDAGAVYPLTIDPWVQQQKLLPLDGASSDNFGASVALSGDTALVGVTGDDDNGSGSGSAYVFIRSGTTWSQQQKLLPADGAADDNFGFAVALDGDTAVVGAPEDDDIGSSSGSVYVFVRSGTTWSQQQKLLPADGAADDNFGWSVALGGDTALVGAGGDDDNGSASGSAYVFVRSGTTWSQQQKLLPADGAADDDFGFAVALDADNALIGAVLDDDNGSASGSAYVFVRSGTTWSQQQKLLPADGAASDFIGWSVALDGDTALVGALYDDDNGSASGSAYVFSHEPDQPLVASAACNGDNLEVTISGGDGPFNITDPLSMNTPHLPLNGVGTGTHVIQGPDRWNGGVSVTETVGDIQTLLLSPITCVNLDGSILIPAGAPGTADGAAGPYPATQVVSGLGDTIADVNITLTDLGHTFPADVEVLLVSPQGTAVLIMNDACSNWGGFLYDFTFDDEAGGPLLNANGCSSGTFQPSSFATTTFPAPAPAGPYTTSLSAFDGEDPNGTWSLFVNDDLGGDYGDLGSWSLDITTASPSTLVASAVCVDENMAVTISAGDGPFNITASAGVNMPVLGVGIGTTTINGPEKWDDVTVTETSGNHQSINLGQFRCRSTEVPAPLTPAHRARTTNPFPTFSWTGISMANNYRVFVFDDANPATRTVDIRQNSGGPTSMTLSTPLPNGRLFWRVRGRQNRLWSLWSVRFTLFKDPPPPLSVSTPVPTINLNPPNSDNPVPTVGSAPTVPTPPNSR